jgi:hypothetical protein
MATDFGLPPVPKFEKDEVVVLAAAFSFLSWQSSEEILSPKPSTFLCNEWVRQFGRFHYLAFTPSGQDGATSLTVHAHVAGFGRHFFSAGHVQVRRFVTKRIRSMIGDRLCEKTRHSGTEVWPMGKSKSGSYSWSRDGNLERHRARCFTS